MKELGIIKQMVANGDLSQDVAEKYCPELKESEDERIRKALIEHCQKQAEMYNTLLTGKEYSKVQSWIAWLEKQGGITKLSEEEQNRFAKGVLSSCALSFINYLDAHKYEGKMCVSNGECEDIENAFHNAMWDRLHRYYCKYIEKQDEQKQSSDAYLKGYDDGLRTNVKMQEEKPNPYSGTSFDYNGHTWGMCARDNGVEILIDGHLKGRVFTDDNNAKEMFIKALERVEEQNSKGYKLTDCDKNSWWEDFKVYCSKFTEKPCEQEPKGKSALEAAKEEKVDNQNCVKPVDEAETKFKVGDFIVNDYCMGRVIELTDDAYLLDTGQGIPFSCEHNARLWDITKDAKDGDVLAAEDKGKVFLYNGKLDLRGRVCAYCGIYETHDGLRFTKCAIGNYFTYKEPYPATKEQRSLLFQKMKESGYEWNADRKELKKIEQKLEWSEEDNKRISRIYSIISEAADEHAFFSTKRLLGDAECIELQDFLKSLKSRVQSQPKQEWSEEDERNASYICAALDCYYRLREDRNNTNGQEDLDKARNWLYNKLKSLNPHNRWEPSDEQMDALDSTLQYGQVSHYSFEHLNSLFNDLKKLREK